MGEIRTPAPTREEDKFSFEIRAVCCFPEKSKTGFEFRGSLFGAEAQSGGHDARVAKSTRESQQLGLIWRRELAFAVELFQKSYHLICQHLLFSADANHTAQKCSVFMVSNQDTKKLIARVEENTGYRVTVDAVSGIHDHAQMISARPDSPAHLIQVNTKHLNHSEYIVAVQCWILLILWSNPAKVPGMALDRAECALLAEKLTKSEQLAGLEPDFVERASIFFVDGILRQLNSMPLELRASNLCYEFCPSLREAQIKSFGDQMRYLSGLFSAKVKDQTPPEIFKMNMAMTAALAIDWARLSGSKIHLLPYQSIGIIDDGQRLLDAMVEPQTHTSESHIRTVDSWAEQLSLSNLYRWQYSDRTQ